MRKEFSSKTKVTLAQRSGYICCYPSCETLTIGPNEESNAKTSSVGMACHIYSASLGLNAKRTNPNLSDDQVADISNGIWMCYTHGKLIDTDDVRFTPEILKEWKRIGESIALLRQETGCDYRAAFENLSLNKFVQNEIKLPKEFGVNSLVGNALHDSCVYVAWGKDVSESIRDFVIEHIRNSYEHGKASSSSISISGNEILVTDNGKEFDPRFLYIGKSKSGGSIAIAYLLENFGERLFLSSYRDGSRNVLKLSVVGSTEELKELTPCIKELTIDQLHDGEPAFQVLESCREIFVLLPDYFSLSDLWTLSLKNPVLKDNDRHLIFVMGFVSKHVQEHLKQQFSNCQIMALGL